MGEAGRRRVRQRYAWRAVAAATADCYEEAIGVAAGAPAPDGRRGRQPTASDADRRQEPVLLTVDFGRLGVGTGNRVLDIGCGGGRHAFESYRRGADVVALDRDEGQLSKVAATFAAMAETGEATPTSTAQTVCGDALAIPFPDESFDRIIAAEVLEHIADDRAAMAEIVRVLAPGGGPL